ncbi:MAG: PLP-dependent aminotransferase family protein [Flavobacteriaceae bacterium]|nr:PLP-dependent aminotransferase family protein [Flavobacteriaceae bacterium]
MLPYKNLIRFEKPLKSPLYMQICNGIMELIKKGVLARNHKLPSTRELAMQLHLHRKTVVKAYDELAVQGWVVKVPAKGTFVHHALPIVQKQTWKATGKGSNLLANFHFYLNEHIDKGYKDQAQVVQFSDGEPDVRLTPWPIIGRYFRSIAGKFYFEPYFRYGDPKGNIEFRTSLQNYLQDTRGMKMETSQIMSTRGSQFAIFLAIQVLVQPGDTVVVGESNYRSSEEIVLQKGGRLKRIAVDRQGLNVQALEQYCEKKSIKAVYITPHHHHPTTVTLSAPRRIKLLQLAKKYRFAIIEDDYDYDYHYGNAPILPLFTGDMHGNVIYVGGFSKVLAPAIRVGYMVGPKDFITEAADLRRIMDRQGNNLMELVIKRMMDSGEIKSHIRKTLAVYKKRRDLLCAILERELGAFVSFEKPKGGLAIWLQLDKNYSWKLVAEELRAGHIDVGNFDRYDISNTQHGGIRMGFANLNEEEMLQIVSFMQASLQKQRQNLFRKED